MQEFKRQIKEKGLNDLEVLVAFSGEVKDNDDVFTEEGMNKDKEGKTIKRKGFARKHSMQMIMESLLLQKNIRQALMNHYFTPCLWIRNCPV